jgi:hypothetical protein
MLDEELASGRISADDYRSRREQIMSSAVGNQQAGGVTVGETTTMLPPVSQQNQTTQTTQVNQGAQGAQSPQGTQGAPGAQGGQQGEDSEKTQIVAAPDVGDPERTQTVGGGWRTTPPMDDAASRTQFVPGVPPQSRAGGQLRPAPPPSPPGGFPQQGQYQNQPPWQNEEELAPPWAGQEFPPLAATGTPDWSRQGPEVFGDEKKSNGLKIFGIIAIVVVLLGIAAGAYFLFGRGDNKQNTADPTNEQQQNPPPATSEAPSTTQTPEGPIAELPGDVSDMKDVDTFAKVVALNYLDKQEIKIYQNTGATKAQIAISTENDVQLIVLVTDQKSPAAAVKARNQLDTLQRKFKLAKVSSSQAGVLTGLNDKASRGPIYRAHYASGNQVVRVQAQGQDKQAVTEAFNELLDAQLERLPADG